MHRLWLAPGQIGTIIVTCHIPQTVAIGTKDKITLSSSIQGSSIVRQSAIITVTSPQTSALVRNMEY